MLIRQDVLFAVHRKEYLKNAEKWKDWENVEMKWISHHNPDFVVLDDNGNEKERYDLQGWSAAKLEKVMEVWPNRGSKRLLEEEEAWEGRRR